MTFHAVDVDAFLAENKINSVGRLCVLLFVANKLREMSYPFSVGAILSEGGGQIRGLNGRSVRKILSQHGIAVPPATLGEAGRTNRGSVRSAEKFIEWINSHYEPNGLDTGALNFLEDSLIVKIVELLSEEKTLYDSLPTSDPNYVGPRFEVRGKKFALQKGRVIFENDDVHAIEKLVHELKRVIAEIEESVKTTHNAYHKLKSLIGCYGLEVNKDKSEVSIFPLYAIGLQIEAQIDAVGSSVSEDPPFDAERGALLKAFQALHGTLIASASEGKALLSASALYRENAIDLDQFRQQTTELTREVRSQGLIEDESADFVVETASIAGKGKTPVRTGLLAILTSRNLWSTVIGSVITSYVVPEAGSLIGQAFVFVRTHGPELIALANSAPDFFQWLVNAIDWLKGRD